jgi:hypothetical protein
LKSSWSHQPPPWGIQQPGTVPGTTGTIQFVKYLS